MHILVVHQYFLGKGDAGGSRWNQFAKYWAEKGHKVTVLAGTVHYATGEKESRYKGKYVVREREQENVEVLRCHVSESYNKSFIGRFWAYLSFTFSSVLAGLLWAGKADAMICTSPPLSVGLTGWMLSKFKRIPMVFEVRDLWPESAIDTGVLTNKWLIKVSYWLERLSYKSAKWINVLTPAFEESLIANKGISPDMISMIPNGADLDIFHPGDRNNWVREKHDLGDKFVVTYVGAHGRANALMQLIESAKILKEKDGEVQIMLVGDGMEKAGLIEAAKEAKLENVTFVEPVSKAKIVDYVNAADACTAVLKKVDTFKTVYPNKVFDYMSAARPVIVGIDGVARKLLEDARAGMYVEPENAGAFVEAVLKLKSNPQLCNEYGQNGLNFVRKNFDRSVLADKYLDILKHQVVHQER
ncbi:MAG: glycosyltransferase [Actinobacteria bacterium]|nr:glycosyltransferase [Actinomycetota bacterium]